MLGKHFLYWSANIEDGAKLDIDASGILSYAGQRAFFDVRVFNSLAHFHYRLPLTACYWKNEQEENSPTLKEYMRWNTNAFKYCLFLRRYSSNCQYCVKERTALLCEGRITTVYTLIFIILFIYLLYTLYMLFSMKKIKNN